MRRLLTALQFGLLALFLSRFAAGEEPGKVESTDPKLEHAVFVLINQYRTSENLIPLSWSPEIAETARAHSRDMATGAIDFGHAGFRDRTRHLASVFLGLTGCGENVLETSDPHDAARSAVALWLKSPPHLHNIRGDFTLSGIGTWVSPGGVIYFTEIFVRAPRSTDAGEGPN
jgi:uncharacterized protein YkwD